MISRINTRFDGKTAKIALAALSVLLYCSAINYFYTGFLNDDARHILSARALLDGNYNDPTSPWPAPITNQLPGYPLLIALPLALGGVFAVKLLSVICAAAAGWLLAGPAALLFALHPMTLTISGTAMTEPAYIALSLLVFALLAKDAAAAPLLLSAFAAWIRPHGFLLLIAVIPFCAKTRRHKAIAAAALAFALLPYLRNFIVSGTPAAYFNEIPKSGGLAALWLNLTSNALYYFRAAGSFPFAAQLPPAAALVLALPVWTLLARGASRLLDSEARPRVLYCLLVFGLQLFWVNQSIRYLYILLPFIYELLAAGVPELNKKIKLAAVAALAGLMLWQDGRLITAARRKENIESRAPAAAIAWIRANTGENAVFMAPYKDMVYFLTGRKTLGYFFNPDPARWRAALREMGVKYIWLDRAHPPIEMTPRRREEIRNVFAFMGNESAQSGKFARAYSNTREGIEIRLAPE